MAAQNGSAIRHRTTNGQPKGETPKSEPVKSGAAAYLSNITDHGKEIDKKMDSHEDGDWEFGGPAGTLAMMLGFPCLMYYLWICLWHYQGQLIHPTSFSLHSKGGISPFIQNLWGIVKKDAYPTMFAFKTYAGLTVIQLILAVVMPGLDQEGLPVPSLNYHALLYHCNALSSFYTTLVLAFTFHVTGIFRLPWLIEHFGELMTWGIIFAFFFTILIYTLSINFDYGGKPMRMSGNLIYDVFMGASLNPRIFTSQAFALYRKRWDGVDLKMFAEVRVPWVLLFMLAISGAVKQWEDLGYVTPNMCHMVLATGLYMNACAKGEHMIPQTWDMYHEKFGFMLIFWNMAGVPFTYCYPILYMARAEPSTYKFPIVANIALVCVLLGAYYVFDTSMSQKSAFKMQSQGVYVPRPSFPSFAGGVCQNPTFIQTKHGNKLLTSGWWAWVRKPNYTADWIQALTWGLSAGFNTPITFFYPLWFLLVLTHRCGRDFERCARKYGDDWDRYCQVVKYRFIPGVY